MGSQTMTSRLPTLRFRGKIMLGFAVVLTISAASMGIAWLGFERVAAGVESYRNSVSEADLARNIDRELISYQALARYFVLTGNEDDGKAALSAEAGLKDAIDQSMRGTSISRCWPEASTLTSSSGTARSVRITGAIFMTSGRVPIMQSTFFFMRCSF